MKETLTTKEDSPPSEGGVPLRRGGSLFAATLEIRNHKLERTTPSANRYHPSFGRSESFLLLSFCVRYYASKVWAILSKFRLLAEALKISK